MTNTAMRPKLPTSTWILLRTIAVTVPELVLGPTSIYTAKLAIGTTTPGKPAVPKVLLAMRAA